MSRTVGQDCGPGIRLLHHSFRMLNAIHRLETTRTTKNLAAESFMIIASGEPQSKPKEALLLPSSPVLMD
jgi:hypothetical protein